MACTYPPFYDVEAAVGKNSPNQQMDVMLVQYFLFNILIGNNWHISLGPWMPQNIGLEAIFPHDGVYRPQLVEWIKVFQQCGNQNGLGPLSVDGVVSHGGAAWGRRKPRAHNWYAIHAMNHVLFLADKGRFFNLANDPTVPSALQAALRTLVTNIDTV